MQSGDPPPMISSLASLRYTRERSNSALTFGIRHKTIEMMSVLSIAVRVMMMQKKRFVCMDGSAGGRTLKTRTENPFTPV